MKQTMVPEPKYAQNIIVGVILHTTFSWYITDTEYWYLDYTKYDSALLASGYTHTPLRDYSFRFDIAVLNEETAADFLSHIENCRVTAPTLTRMMVARRQAKKDDDLLDFAPCLLVNFDQRQFSSQFPEMIRFEIYVPDNWVGSYRDFEPEIPDNERYWIVNGRNLFLRE